MCECEREDEGENEGEEKEGKFKNIVQCLATSNAEAKHIKGKLRHS